jgi:predicted nucleic acid-binding protein
MTRSKEAKAMGSSTALIDPSRELVADASTIINLIATGCTPAIAAALPNQIAVVDVILGELETGRPRGRRDADRLRDFIKSEVIRVVSLGEVGLRHFEDLVVGPSFATLDDGEAATIGYAAEHAAVALIDERKAARICGERFPEVRVACTVDVLIHPSVQSKLGPEGLVEAVYNALQDGRMRVLPHHLEYVVGLIGPERAARCTSLPRSARSSTTTL